MGRKQSDESIITKIYTPTLRALNQSIYTSMQNLRKRCC